MSNQWRVRYEGSPTVVEVASAQKVLEGLRDGEWEPADEVRGPADAAWTTIEDHPLFADPVAEMEPPPAEKPDETHLDMNPLIDVALVLLVFFILTTSYASLRRVLDVPAEQTAPGAPLKPTEKDLDSKAFRVEAWMADDRPRVRIDERIVEVGDLEKEIAAVVKNSGRREMLLIDDGKILWGVRVAILDAAKAADVNQIYTKLDKNLLSKITGSRN